MKKFKFKALTCWGRKNDDNLKRSSSETSNDFEIDASPLKRTRFLPRLDVLEILIPDSRCVRLIEIE